MNKIKTADFREIIIPGDVLDDARLSDGAKILYGKIARLSYKTGFCWATNAFFDGTKSGNTASRQIKELIDARYIESRIDDKGIRQLRIREINNKIEEPPLTKNGEPPSPEMVNPLTRNGEPPLTRNGEQTLQDLTNLNLTAAAGPPEAPPDAEQAAAAPVTPQKLKEALQGVDKTLILKTAFYPKAAAFMARYGLDTGYLDWLYRQCGQRKPDSMKGLYYTLFCEEDMAEQYTAARKARAALLQPPPPIICPACGQAHGCGDGRCPSCGLRRDSSPENIALFRQLSSLPPEKRADYFQKEKAIFEECGLDFVKIKPLIDSLKSEFGLAAGL